MRNKILLAGFEKERLLFQEALQDFMEGGGEFFFADKKESALEILQKEHPQLVFVDYSFYENEWESKGVLCVILCEREEHVPAQKEHLFKPLKKRDILTKCHQVFAAFHTDFPQIPPM